MAGLTDTQVLVLSSATRDEAGLATRPDKLKPAAAAKVAASLIASGYVRECLTKSGAPIWRKDADGKAYSLKILKAGRAAVAAIDDLAAGALPDALPLPTEVMALPIEAPNAPRAGSKIAGVVGLLDKGEGVSTCELIAATGWLPHTLRASLTGLRKRGYTVEHIKREDGCGAYRIGNTLFSKSAA